MLLLSFNRTRWLDKLRPASASSGGWAEGPMAPVETLLSNSAAPSNIGQGRDTTDQNRFCVPSCAWVKLIFSVSRICTCHLCTGGEKTSDLCGGRRGLLHLSWSAFARNSHLRPSSRGLQPFASHKHHRRPFWRETWR